MKPEDFADLYFLARARPDPLGMPRPPTAQLPEAGTLSSGHPRGQAAGPIEQRARCPAATAALCVDSLPRAGGSDTRANEQARLRLLQEEEEQQDRQQWAASQQYQREWGFDSLPPFPDEPKCALPECPTRQYPNSNYCVKHQANVDSWIDARKKREAKI